MNAIRPSAIRWVPVTGVLALLACNPGHDAHDDTEDAYDGTSDDYDWSTGEPDLADTFSGPDTGDADLDSPQSGDVVHNPWVSTADEPQSTFSIDVDRASFSYGRRLLLAEGRLPAPATVRVEEWINAMTWHDAGPTDDMPFAIHLDAAPSHFDDADDLHLLRIGLQAKDVAPADRKPANLVFLIDVSGSMGAPDKLPLVQSLLGMILGQLKPSDTLSIVTYAGADAVVLEPTPVQDAITIQQAINRLGSGGSTAGAAGLHTAYDLAEQAFIPGGINRVMLCTDGDFNVGLTGQALVDEMVERAAAGIDITALGFGIDNLNDSFLEDLTNQADGTYGFIGSSSDAETFVEDELLGALQVVARDTKIQVGFDADTVLRWRLIGYANRILDHEDFDDDSKDAGDIGAGHHVTAYYEVELTGEAGALAEIRLRHQPPEGGASILQTRHIDRSEVTGSFAQASEDFRAGAAIAEFAEVLAGSPHVGTEDLTGVRSIMTSAWPGTPSDRQQEFIDMIEEAIRLRP